MQFNISTVVALLLFLLTSNSLVSADGCYSDGATWADLGDDADIDDAFHRLCDNMAGTYKLHDNVGLDPAGRLFSWSFLKHTWLTTKIM